MLTAILPEVKVDSVALENNLHEKFRDVFSAVFSDSYMDHKTQVTFQDSALRAMNTVEVTLHLKINKDSLLPSTSGELTSNSWMTYIKNIFNEDVFVAGVQIRDSKHGYVYASVRIVCSKSTYEEVVESVGKFHHHVTRAAYNKNFNVEVEDFLDDNSKI